MPSDAVVWEQVELPDLRGGRTLGLLPRLHRGGDADRLGRPTRRLADPHRRRDGRRPGVRADRRLLRRARRAAARGSRCARLALAVGFPSRSRSPSSPSLIFKATGLAPDDFSFEEATVADADLQPDFFAFFIAFCAGVAGTLSLTTAKSGALIGVLISVTTIPAAAAIAVGRGLRRTNAFAARLAARRQPGMHLHGRRARPARSSTALPAPSRATSTRVPARGWACRWAPSAIGAAKRERIEDPSDAQMSTSCSRVEDRSVNSLVVAWREVGRAGCRRHRLEDRLVDRPRGGVGALMHACAGVAEQRAQADHRHRVREVRAVRAPARCRAAPRPWRRSICRRRRRRGDRSRPGDRAEHRQDEVGQAVAVAVEGGDTDQRERAKILAA